MAVVVVVVVVVSLPSPTLTLTQQAAGSCTWSIVDLRHVGVSSSVSGMSHMRRY
jgi:hypothetical protein